MRTNGMKAMLVTLAFFFSAMGAADACTGVRLKTKDGKTVSGRTLEFGIEVKTSLIAVPENYAYTSKPNIWYSMTSN